MYEITLEVTNQCPLNCIHCSSKSNEGEKRELDLQIIESVLRNYRPMWVNISGGEPCLRKDLNEITDIAKLLGIKIRLYTTQFYKDFSNLDEIVVSCYSDKSLINEIITRSEYNPFEIISQYLNHGFIPSVHVVPMSFNIGRVEQTCDKLLSLGINKIKILKLVNQGRCNNDLLPEDKEVKDLYVNLKDKPNIIFGNPFKCNCNAGTEKLVVMSNGKIIPCESYKDGICKCIKLFRG